MNFFIPEEQAELILQLGQTRLYVPSERCYMDLVGENRMTRDQLEEATKHLENKANELDAKAKIIDALIAAPGYYI